MQKLEEAAILGEMKSRSFLSPQRFAGIDFSIGIAEHEPRAFIPGNSVVVVQILLTKHDLLEGLRSN